MFLSIVIPTWREADGIAEAVHAARGIGDEVIVADAASPDGTADRARAAGAVVITAPRSRGAQLHAGALAARGDVLLFLHADAALGPGARAAIARALAEPQVEGGNFLLRFVPESLASSLFGWANHVRRRWLRIYYGDSGIFLRRTTYHELGGFRALPILEDYELVQRLERRGPTAYVREVTIHASSRRFARQPVRTLLIWSWLQLLYSMFGVDPARLSRHYADIRGSSSSG